MLCFVNLMHEVDQPRNPTTHHLAFLRHNEMQKRNEMQELFDLPMIRISGEVFDIDPIKGGLKRRPKCRLTR